MASEPGPAMEFLGRVAYEFQGMRPLFPTYIHLLVSAIFPIYTAAHASLARPSSAAPAKKKKKLDDEHDDEDDEDEPSPKIETLTPSDAILFPVLAGCTLSGLYFILKVLKDPEWLNWFLGIYFAIIGLFFATKFFKDSLSVARSILLPLQYSRGGKLWKASIDDRQFSTERDTSSKGTNASPLPGFLSAVPLPKSLSERLWTMRKIFYEKAHLELRVYKFLHFKAPVDTLDLISLTISVCVIGYHTFIDKPWFFTNLLGFSYCYGTLQFMSPGTSWTGSLLLSALFFYDIYFVFYTPMMVTVATKLEVPIKLLFPRPDGCVVPVGAEEGSAAMEEYLKCIAKKRTMAMLGLGDIVIPGMMLAFALRFDLYLFYLRMKKSQDSAGQPSIEDIKSTYRSATGSWGERLWTRSLVRGEDLQSKRFPKTYFYVTVIGYVVGMIVTVTVMQVAQHAQPALLYLVPGVLFSLWGTALVKGDLKLLWNYSEMSDEDGKDDEKATNQVDAKSENETTEDGKKQKAITAQTNSSEATNDASTPDPNTSENETKALSTTDDTQKPRATKPADLDQNDSHILYFAIRLPEPPKTPDSKAEKVNDLTSDSKESSDSVTDGESLSEEHSSNDERLDEKTQRDSRTHAVDGQTDDAPPEKKKRRKA